MASLKKRGSFYYAQYYVGTKQKRVSLETGVYQVAKEKLRQLESSLVRGEVNPLPSKTPIPQVLGAYVEHIRAHKTPKSAQTEIYYLRRHSARCATDSGSPAASPRGRPASGR
jgi:hypothetical protein